MANGTRQYLHPLWKLQPHNRCLDLLQCHLEVFPHKISEYKHKNGVFLIFFIDHMQREIHYLPHWGTSPKLTTQSAMATFGMSSCSQLHHCL